MTAGKTLSGLPAFASVKSQAALLRSTSIESLFAHEPERALTFTLEAANLQLDYSRHLLNSSAMAALQQLVEQANLSQGISDLFNGEHLNNTEDRPALHTLLRATSAGTQTARYADVAAARERMKSIVQRLNQGEHAGFSGDAITDVVNIGIGGSDLGPRLVTEALTPFHSALRCHYVANVDPADFQQVTASLNAATTLFIICSKSFRTEETLANGLAARSWVLNAGATQSDLNRHFLAVTSNVQEASDFGIQDANCLPMWDWVGGRYSVWSAVGLSCAIAIGWERFTEFLAGAALMDEHFRSAPAATNMPIIMSLLELWYSNFFDAGNHVVLPYDHNMRRLSSYLQQLTMESNGKRVSVEGEALDYTTAPVLWGSAGTIGQHSFHQLLHQGQLLCPVDFILPLTTHTGMERQHRRLVANCLAQCRALMIGRSLEAARELLSARGLNSVSVEKLAPHLVMPGNRPSSIISMESLTPATLGALLALYEHRTFCSGQLWRINSFDQWGVELGKEISADILRRMTDPETVKMDPATERLINAWQHAQQGTLQD